MHFIFLSHTFFPNIKFLMLSRSFYNFFTNTSHYRSRRYLNEFFLLVFCRRESNVMSHCGIVW